MILTVSVQYVLFKRHGRAAVVNCVSVVVIIDDVVTRVGRTTQRSRDLVLSGRHTAADLRDTSCRQQSVRLLRWAFEWAREFNVRPTRSLSQAGGRLPPLLVSRPPLTAAGRTISRYHAGAARRSGLLRQSTARRCCRRRCVELWTLYRASVCAQPR